MSAPITHFLIPVFILGVLRHFFPAIKAKINSKHVLLAGFFGLVPDLDLLIVWLLNFLRGESLSDYHRLYFHNLFFVLGIFLILILFCIYKRKRLCLLSGVMLFSVIIHLILDSTFGRVMWLYPFSLVKYGFNLAGVGNISWLIQVGLDALIFSIWIMYMIWVGKIRKIV